MMYRRGRFCLYLSILFSLVFFPILASCNRSGEETLPDEEPISVKAEVDRGEINIGDRIRYTITVRSKPEFEVQLPQFGENLGGFAIEDFGTAPPEKSRGWVEIGQWYILSTYTTGTYTIPPPIIKYKDAEGVEGQIEGQEVTIEVKSLIKEGEEPEDIRDIKPPVGLPVNYTPYILGVIGGVCAIVGVVIARLFLKRRRVKVEEEKRKPPHVIAYEGLEYISSLRLVEEGKISQYYVLISDLIRHYLENRFGLRAPEMTTEEFLDVLSRADELAEEHKLLLKDFLSHCDLVKFARYGPTEDEIKNVFTSAKRLVDETKEEEEVEAQEAA